MRQTERIPNRFTRQLDIIKPGRLKFHITVIGAGAIGSATVVTLAKMGCSNISVWDSDTLERVNIPNQLCKISEIGNPKVDALARLTKELTGIAIQPVNSRYRGQKLRDVVISTVDNMNARINLWKRAKRRKDITLLIDARMGAEFARLYAVHPTEADEVRFYANNLYEEAENLPCSGRSIVYCPTVVAGFITLLIKQHALNRPIPKEVLIDLPNLVLQSQ